MEYEEKLKELMGVAEQNRKKSDEYQRKFCEAIKYLEKVNNYKRKYDEEDEEQYFESYKKIKDYEEQTVHKRKTYEELKCERPFDSSKYIQEQRNLI